jgi:hypothetical protein
MNFILLLLFLSLLMKVRNNVPSDLIWPYLFELRFSFLGHDLLELCRELVSQLRIMLNFLCLIIQLLFQLVHIKLGTIFEFFIVESALIAL